MRPTFRIPLWCVGGALCLASCGDDSPRASPDASTDGGADGGADGGTDTDTGPGDTAIWVAAGWTQSCAVIDGGYVKCWGTGQFGELGYGYDLEDYPEADSSLPSTLPFVNVGAGVSGIEAGINETCSQLTDGTAKCWGADGDYGALGVPVENMSDTIGRFDVPADYPAIDFGAPIRQIDTGGGHACVVLEVGDVVCWGNSEHGETGYGGAVGYNMGDPSLSARIDLGGAASQISTGTNHTCAVLENGDVYCWGDAQYGALGYGDHEDIGDDEVPADVGPVDLGAPAVQVSCGGYHTCALLESGEVICWGLGDNGQLGYGNTDTIGDDETLATVGPVAVGAAVTRISAGERFTCAVLEGGSVKCWGAIAYGIGYVVGDDELPADAPTVEVGTLVTSIDAGWTYICALTPSGTVRCWGNGAYGQLGYGPGVDYVGDDETPAEMGDVPLF